ncbi:MAG: hypothetical protein V1798_00880 [Pseudomonadota bacterium]
MAALVSVLLAAVFSFVSTPVVADEAPLAPAFINATNVDITTDTGEVLGQRLTTGDQVWVVRKAKQKRQGWVRISRSPNDTEGIGWVEFRYVHVFERWESPREEPRSAPAVPAAPSAPVERNTFSSDLGAPRYGQVGVLPFTAPDADDPVAKWAYDAFTLSLRNSGRVPVTGDSLAGERFSPDRPDSIQKILKARNLDGVFVGSLSSEMGSSRLLQVKFYKKGKNAPVLEKVKKLPKEGNLKEIIDGLVATCVSGISSR